MYKQILRLLAILFFILCLPLLVFAESLTITTYYPSPYGSYNELYVYSKLGVGTTSPQEKLDVVGNAQADYLILNGTDEVNEGGELRLDGAGSYYDYHIDNFQGRLRFIRTEGGGAETATILQNGNAIFYYNFGIGMTPSYQLQLSTDSAAKPSTTTWTTTSDIRVKKDIRPYANGLEIIKKINPVWFKYNGKGGFPDDGQNHIGVIAQEIEKIAPYTVNTFRGKLNPEDKEDTELLNFNPHALIFDLINSVKELDVSINKLTQENQQLKSEIESLKERLERKSE